MSAMHSRRRLRVKGCLAECVSITAGVPLIAAYLLHRPSRQSRADAVEKVALSSSLAVFLIPDHRF